MFSAAASPSSPATGPHVLPLNLLRRTDCGGLSQKAGEKLGFSPEQQCATYNRTAEKKASDCKEVLESTHRQRTALQELRRVFDQLKTNVRELGASGMGGLWNERTALVRCANPQERPETYLGVRCDPGCEILSLTLDIQQVVPPPPPSAAAGIKLQNMATPMGIDGVLSTDLKDITITSETTLNELVFTLNQVGCGGFSPLMTKPASEGGDAIFQILSPEEGPIFTDDQGGSVVGALGLKSKAQAVSGESRILLRGVPITRLSNTMEDLLPGIHVTVRQQTPAGQSKFLEVQIGLNKERLTESLTQLADNLREFQSLVTAHAPNDHKSQAPLKDAYFLRQLVQDLRLNLIQPCETPLSGQGIVSVNSSCFGLDVMQGSILLHPHRLEQALKDLQACHHFFVGSPGAPGLMGRLLETLQNHEPSFTQKGAALEKINEEKMEDYRKIQPDLEKKRAELQKAGANLARAHAAAQARERFEKDMQKMMQGF